MNVLLCKITGKEAEDDFFLNRVDILDRKKTEQIFKYKSIKDQSRSLVAHLMVWCYLTDKSGKLKYSYNENGKPKLIGASKDFSVSHSGDYVALATDSNSVGVDIERIENMKPQTAKYFCSYEELEFLKENNNINLYKLWTLKEAYIKYAGIKSAGNLNKISFKLEADRIICNKNLNFYSYIIDNYCLSLCSKSKAVTLNHIDTEQLKKDLK